MALTDVKQAGLDDEAVNESKLQISNAGTNGQYLQKQSGNTGGLTWADVPAGVGGATGVDFNDDVKIRSGTGNDLEIYHDGSNSYVKNATGDIIFQHGAENLMQLKDDGAVQIYYDNAQKLATESTGVAITGALSFGDGTGAGGTNKVSFGASDDLNIYHDATANSNAGASIIKDTGAGGLWLGTSDFYVKTGDLSETMIRALPNGAVELYHDNTKKLETVTGGVTVTGTCTATAFAGDGSNLTGISAGAALTGSTNNTVVTVTGANAMQGEATLTYDGSTLQALSATPKVKIEETSTGGSKRLELFVTSGGQPTIAANQSSQSIAFQTTGSERFRITNDGVTFNGDTAAANGLDDYEEGDWTPGSPASTATSVTGKYTKIGRHVFFEGSLTFGAESGNNRAQITGLPFNASGAYGGGYIRYTNVNPGEKWFSLDIPSGNNYIEMNESSPDSIKRNDVSTKRIDFCGMYIA